MTSRVFSRRIAAVALAFLVLVGFQATAQAQVFNGTFPIDGSQEVPPNGSGASGSGTVTLDTSTNLFSWNITFGGLGSAQTAAHFHGPAGPGSNAGVQVGIGTGSPNVGSTTVSPSQAADIQAGLWYINIHSAGFPGGEIRGQVLVAPVGAIPTMGEWGLATLAVLMLGVGVVLLRRRTALAAQ